MNLPVGRTRARTRARGHGGAPAWTPARLTPYLWLDSALGITVTGAGVSTWADQSGGGRDLTQGTDASRPVYTSSRAAFGGRASVDGDASIDGVVAATAADWTFLHDGAADSTILLVAVRTSEVLGWVLNTQGGSGANKGITLLDLGNGNARYTIGNGAGGFTNVTGTSAFPAVGTAVALEVAFVASGAGMTVRRGATSVGTGTAPAPGAGAPVSALVALNYSALASGFGGSLASLVVLQRALTTAERASWLAYVSRRWGSSVVVA